MKYEHMFMALLFVISVTALVVGSIALSKDDRDEIIVDDDSELNSTLSLASRGPGHRSKITTIYLAANDNVVVVPTPYKPPTQYFITIPPHTNYTFELDMAFYIGSKTYLVTGSYVEGANNNSNNPSKIRPLIQNNTSSEITVQLIVHSKYSNLLTEYITRKEVMITVHDVYSFHSRAPEIINLTGRVEPQGTRTYPSIQTQLYTGATLAFN